MKQAKKIQKEFANLMSQERRAIYIVLEDMNFHWPAKDIETVLRLWNEGMSINYIGKQVERDVDEISLLLVELAERHRGKVFRRNRGVLVSSEINLKKISQYYKRLLRFLDKYPDGYKLFETWYNIDFVWDEREVLRFEEMWNKGISFQEIFAVLKRNEIDCLLLLFDRVRKGSIHPREGGLDGWKKQPEKEQKKLKNAG